MFPCGSFQLTAFATAPLKTFVICVCRMSSLFLFLCSALEQISETKKRTRHHYIGLACAAAFAYGHIGVNRLLLLLPMAVAACLPLGGCRLCCFSGGNRLCHEVLGGNRLCCFSGGNRREKTKR